MNEAVEGGIIKSIKTA